MCRNIQTLYNFEPEATHDEVHAAALQYVPKISGFTKPSRANEEAFSRDEVILARIYGNTAALAESAGTTSPRSGRA